MRQRSWDSVRHYAAKRARILALYDTRVARNLAQYGEPRGWPHRWISGVINDEWPESAKARLRACHRAMNRAADLAIASRPPRSHKKTAQRIVSAAWSAVVRNASPY